MVHVLPHGVQAPWPYKEEGKKKRSPTIKSQHCNIAYVSTSLCYLV